MDVSTLLAEGEWIGGLAARLVRDSHQAEDIAQETRLAALRAAPRTGSGDDDESLRPWLATVARNGARMLGRSESSRRAREADRALEIGDEAASPEELVTRAETQELLLRLVRELPPELCDVILANFFDGRSPSEIARLRGLSPGTVRWRKSEALKRLRERLDTHFDGDRSAWLAALLPLVPSHLPGAAAASGGTSLGALLTTWIAMSLPWKAAVLTSLAGLAFLALTAVRGSAILPSEAPGAPAPKATIVASRTPSGEVVDGAPAEPIGKRVEVDLDANGPADPRAAAELQLITRVGLRVVDANGRPVSGARVTPSLSLEMEDAHRADFEALDAGALAMLLAGLVRTSDDAGLVHWETDLLREGGAISFSAVGPRQGTGELVHTVEAGEDSSAGDLALHPAGAVFGTLRFQDGGRPPTQMVFLIAADSPILEAEQVPFNLLGHPAVVGADHIDWRGAFRLDGVPAGRYVLMTSRLSGFDPVRSEPFEVVPGSEGSAVELVLEAPPLGRPQVLVLGADGRPLVKATVKLVGPSLTFEGSTNTKGIYSLAANYERFAGGRLEVIDNTLRHRPALVEPVPTTPQTITIRMELAPTVERALELVGADDETPREHWVTVSKGTGRTIASGAGGNVPLLLPAALGETFDLRIYSPGFQVEQLEGLYVEDLPDPWRVVLKALPGVSGVVTQGGKPVAGATVALHGHLHEGRVGIHGTHVSLRGSEVDSVKTNSMGEFCVHLTDDGDYVLAVSARRSVDAVRPLAGLLVDVGQQKLEVGLDDGGELEGVARDGDGHPLPGVVVVLAHPYHDLLRKKSRKDGSFRFPRVSAGDWYVRVVREFESAYMTQHRSTPEGWTYPANCTVRTGETARFDPVLSAARGSSVDGAWLVDGRDVGAWSVELGVGGWSADATDPFIEPWTETVPLGPDGRYSIPAAEGCGHNLTLSAPGLGSRFRRVVVAAELPLTLDTHLGLAQLTATHDSTTPRLYVSWKQGLWAYDQVIESGADGAFGPVVVPSGTVNLRWESSSSDRPAPLVLELAAGEDRTVELKDQ